MRGNFFEHVLDDLPWSDPKIVFRKIKSWSLQPDIIVDLKISDQDLTKRRLETRMDPETGKILTKVQYDLQARKSCEELWKKANEKPGPTPRCQKSLENHMNWFKHQFKVLLLTPNPV